MPDGYFVLPVDTSSVEIRPGIHRRRMATTDEVVLFELFMQAGALIPENSNQTDRVGYVVRGALELTIGGQTCLLEAGCSYAIPGGVVFSGQALEDTLVVDVFSPPQQEDTARG